MPVVCLPEQDFVTGLCETAGLHESMTTAHGFVYDAKWKLSNKSLSAFATTDICETQYQLMQKSRRTTGQEIVLTLMSEFIVKN